MFYVTVQLFEVLMYVNFLGEKLRLKEFKCLAKSHTFSK